MARDSSLHLQVWLDRLQDGDATARAELIDRSCRRLRKLTRAMLRDFPRLRAYEESDDVLQNAVVRLLRALEVVTPATTADFFRLAAQQIRRELIDLSRHWFGRHGPGNRQVALPEKGTAGRVEDETPSDSTYHPVRLAGWTEFHEQVELLPTEEREVFDLVWYQGLSQTEVATMLNLSLATVKRRWVAARLRLQAALRDDSLGW